MSLASGKSSLRVSHLNNRSKAVIKAIETFTEVIKYTLERDTGELWLPGSPVAKLTRTHYLSPSTGNLSFVGCRMLSPG